MYPSKPNASAGASSKESEALNLTGPQSNNFGQQSFNASAPLLPAGASAQAPPNFEPPSYSSVVAQDAGDWRNPSGSFANANVQQPHPQVAPYPTDAPAAAPYPSYGAPTQPPYPTGPTYAQGPVGQPPYPVAPTPMPAPSNSYAPIGFTAPVTQEPKPSYQSSGYGPNQTTSVAHVIQPTYSPYNPVQANQQGIIYPTQTGEMYASTQNPQPNVVYVVPKNENTSSSNDDCCLMACCLASCYCLCECIKLCAGSE